MCDMIDHDVCDMTDHDVCDMTDHDVVDMTVNEVCDMFDNDMCEINDSDEFDMTNNDVCDMIEYDVCDMIDRDECDMTDNDVCDVTDRDMCYIIDNDMFGMTINGVCDCYRANQLSYEVALNLTAYLDKERDFVPWKAFLDSIEFLYGMLATSNTYGKLQVGVTLYRKYKTVLHQSFCFISLQRTFADDQNLTVQNYVYLKVEPLYEMYAKPGIRSLLE